jgi:hypothetical protein
VMIDWQYLKRLSVVVALAQDWLTAALDLS